MRKRKSADPSKKTYKPTKNNGGLQIRIRPDFEIKRGKRVRQLIYEPILHEPRPGDLIIRVV